MSDDQNNSAGADGRSVKMSEEELADLVASSDSGARSPLGPVGKLITGVAIAWSVFQLWIASPLPFMVGRAIPVLNLDEQKSIHLAFAIFLVFTAYPALKRSPRDRIPLQDWVLALVGAFCGGFLFLFFDTIAATAGAALPTRFQIFVGSVGLVLLLEATRRALGPPLTVVALVFLLYLFFGNQPFIPEVIQWKGASYNRAIGAMWLTTDGVFGVALGVSASLVFMFVLFGALLNNAGAGNYFIKVAFAALGHLRGGPAKAAVLASAMTGIVSGSSIANVVTTGTFTIPLMKRVGFSPEKAGSVEVASSVNGQLMPPVMGAAAFLIAEFTGISYQQVIVHAVLPATISYIALLYIVHLEALKLNMKGLPKPGPMFTLARRLMGFIGGFVGAAAIGGVIYAVMAGVEAAAGDATGWVAALLVLVVYLALLRYAAQQPDLEIDDPNAKVVELPELWPTVKTGLHFILPIVVLMWMLMVERRSAGLSVFYSTVLMIFIVLTRRPLKGLFRGESDYVAAFMTGWHEMVDGLATGARNMIGIGVATATAGIIVGVVAQTGIGQVMAEFVEFISGGSLILILVFTAVISLILGMGLPTTANYIVVSSIMAFVVVELGAQAGLIVPLVAVHLFVFYFGLMADVTPPVGLASFAAAAVSGGDPLRTGFTAFFYSLRTVALPFLFIFNTDLLLIDVGLIDGIFVFAIATAAMLIFAAATQGYWIARSKLWESAVLLVIAFTLFRPGFWLDQVQPEFTPLPPATVLELAAQVPPDSELRIIVEGPDFNNPTDTLRKTIVVPLGEAVPDGAQRLEQNADILVLLEGDEAILDEPLGGEATFGGRQMSGVFEFYGEEPTRIVAVEQRAERLPKEIFYLPALLLLALVYMLQRRRARAAD